MEWFLANRPDLISGIACMTQEGRSTVAVDRRCGEVMEGSALHAACAWMKLHRDDANWRDLVLFYEYLHGDDGSGVGASPQTGWTGLLAKLIEQSGV